ncbi:transglycosylase SLT domain-containing protein [Helicobacter sp. UBA3407]|uniref:transglycosylase SLT domain-containing protein n=1 Tax=Helicobacter TaxID=209 RepID=UPI0026295F7F|nr:transglycosylase SLT domain-containing protein [Helicobacter sp. UBA3407]
MKQFQAIGENHHHSPTKCRANSSKLINLDYNYTKQYNYDDYFRTNHFCSFWGINFRHRVRTYGEHPSAIISQTAYCFRKFLFGIFLFVFSLLPCFSYDDFEIANALKLASMQNDIDKRVLYTLAKIESNFNPLIISFTAKHTNFHFKNLQKSVKKYKDRYLINFKGSEKELQKALKILLQDKTLKIDVGLMQINNVNFNKSEIPYIFNPSYNTQKATLVLKECIAKKAFMKDSIECYNKGFRKVSNFDYYTKFKKSFLKDFGGMK